MDRVAGRLLRLMGALLPLAAALLLGVACSRGAQVPLADPTPGANPTKGLSSRTPVAASVLTPSVTPSATMPPTSTPIPTATVAPTATPIRVNAAATAAAGLRPEERLERLTQIFAAANPTLGPEEKRQYLFDFGLVVRAKNGEVYQPKQLVLVDDDLAITLERFRVDAPQDLLLQKSYLLIADVTIINRSSREYLSLSSDFSLQDKLSFTYRPTLMANIRGNATGPIGVDQQVRGEIAFPVPITETSFTLSQRTRVRDIEHIAFRIEAGDAVKAAIPLLTRQIYGLP